MGEADRIPKRAATFRRATGTPGVRMGMAVKSELGDAGFGLWNEWSQTDETYNERDATDRLAKHRATRKVNGAERCWRDGAASRQANGWRDDGREADSGRARGAPHRAERARAAKPTKRSARAEARKRAAAILKDSQPASADHPYLKAKGVQAHGLRQYGDKLVIPMRDAIRRAALRCNSLTTTERSDF